MLSYLCIANLNPTVFNIIVLNILICIKLQLNRILISQIQNLLTVFRNKSLVLQLYGFTSIISASQLQFLRYALQAFASVSAYKNTTMSSKSTKYRNRPYNLNLLIEINYSKTGFVHRIMPKLYKPHNGLTCCVNQSISSSQCQPEFLILYCFFPHLAFPFLHGGDFIFLQASRHHFPKSK